MGFKQPIACAWLRSHGAPAQVTFLPIDDRTPDHDPTHLAGDIDRLLRRHPVTGPGPATLGGFLTSRTDPRTGQPIYTLDVSYHLSGACPFTRGWTLTSYSRQPVLDFAATIPGQLASN